MQKQLEARLLPPNVRAAELQLKQTQKHSRDYQQVLRICSSRQQLCKGTEPGNCQTVVTVHICLEDSSVNAQIMHQWAPISAPDGCILVLISAEMTNQLKKKTKYLITIHLCLHCFLHSAASKQWFCCGVSYTWQQDNIFLHILSLVCGGCSRWFWNIGQLVYHFLLIIYKDNHRRHQWFSYVVPRLYAYWVEVDGIAVPYCAACGLSCGPPLRISILSSTTARDFKSHRSLMI